MNQLNRMYNISPRKNIEKIWCLALLLLFGRFAIAQSPDELIRAAWQHDARLAASRFELKAAESAILEARSMYGPSVSFGTQYTRAAGGRVIEVPIGDIVNPVYATLNALTQSNMFPVLQNEKTYFLPDNFYDSRFRIQQAIYYPDLEINKLVRTEQRNLKELEIRSYKRLLSKEVMQAYYGAQSAAGVLSILKTSGELLLEVRKLTESMIRNGVALPATLYRINSDIADLDIKIRDAENNVENVKAYLKYLTGKDVISLMPSEQMELPFLAKDEDSNTREELQQIDKAITLQQLSLKNEENFYKPRIGAVLDLGSQAFDFGWAPYVLLGLNIEMNLYDSGKNKNRRSQVRSSIEAAEHQKLHLARQLDLQKSNAERSYATALAKIRAFTPKLEAAERTYKDIFNAYKAGSAGYLEMLDARTNLTTTRLEQNLYTYDAWMKYAEWIYVTASYPVDTDGN